jgi:hypothetical protein
MGLASFLALLARADAGTALPAVLAELPHVDAAKGIELRLCLIVMLAPSPSTVLVRLLAPPAPPFGIDLVLEEGGEAADERKSGEEPQQPTARAAGEEDRD